MKKYLVFFVIFLLLQYLSSSNSSLEETCNKVKRNQNEYHFCITSLQVDSRSQKADTKGLAIITTNLAKINFTHNLKKVKKLLKDTKTLPEAKQALEDCLEVYSDGTSNLGEAVEEIKLCNIFAARTHLSASETDVETCKQSLEELEVGTLLLKENEDALRISALGLSITTLLSDSLLCIPSSSDHSTN